MQQPTTAPSIYYTTITVVVVVDRSANSYDIIVGFLVLFPSIYYCNTIHVSCTAQSQYEYRAAIIIAVRTMCVNLSYQNGAIIIPSLCELISACKEAPHIISCSILLVV